jgi:hypothetical protein
LFYLTSLRSAQPILKVVTVHAALHAAFGGPKQAGSSAKLTYFATWSATANLIGAIARIAENEQSQGWLKLSQQTK